MTTPTDAFLAAAALTKALAALSTIKAEAAACFCNADRAGMRAAYRRASELADATTDRAAKAETLAALARIASLLAIT